MPDLDLTTAGARSLTDDLYARPKSLKIFISSRMRGEVLVVERQRAAAAVETIPRLAHAWYWERDAHAGPYSSEEICLGQAATSDGLILILGDELTKVTRQEFDVAYERGVPIYLLLDQRQTPDAEADAFITEQQQPARRIVTKGFQNVSELESHILDAIVSYAVHAVRIVNFDRGAARAARGGGT